MKTRHLLLILALFLCGCGGCTSAQSGATAQSPASVQTLLPLRLGEVAISAQLALSRQEQARGLMFRTELADGEGMLFAYKAPQRMSYWMNNVPIGLDIGFFDAQGTLVEIRHMLPNDTRSVPSARDDMQYALEMAAGWYARAGIKPGARLDMGLLINALKARGASPSEYGLK